jgi:hypothetical protein
MRLGVQLAILVGVLALVTAIAELAGAADLGTALGIGQIVFAAVLVWLLLKR